TSRPALFAKEVGPWIKSKAASIHDERLLSLIPFTNKDPSVWNSLDGATRAEIKALIGSCSHELIKQVDIYSGLSSPVFAQALMDRFYFDLPEQMKAEVIRTHPQRVFVPPAIEIYGNSRGFRSAEWNGRH